jgi:ABC-type transport system involved in multi-copper enzyme maturation permease subunit
VKFREIFRFEFVYQARRVRTWLYFAVLFAAAFQLQGTAGRGNAPIISTFEIAQDTILTVMLWALMAPAVAGSAAARDIQTRIYPLIYAAPISKADYLGGRFLAAFVLNAMLLLAVPLGIMTALFMSGADTGAVSPFLPAAFFGAWGVLALPAAFTFTAVQFSAAALRRRPVVSYLSSVLFFITVGAVVGLVTNVLQIPAIGKLLDPTCRVTVMILISDTLTPLEKDAALSGQYGSILANRLLWLCLASGILLFTYNRFRPAYREG